MKVYTSAQTLQVEQNSERNGIDRLKLMVNAGSAAARVIRERYNVIDTKVAVVCGHGNNGGDGYVVARKLQEAGAKVNIIMADGLPMGENAAEMYQRAVAMDIPITDYCDNPEIALMIIKNSAVIVDAIFGTGFHGEMSENIRDLTRYISGCYGDVVSLDLPSGAVCDSGEAAQGCVRAALTISFIALKPCHVLFPSAEYCGETVLVDIGIAPESYIRTDWCATTESDIAPLFGPRTRDCHKGSFGSALMICGSEGMAGAAAISGMAALRCGAGLVTLAVPRPIYSPLASKLFESVFKVLPCNDQGTLSADAVGDILKSMEKATAVLIGCGMGCNSDTVYVTRQVIANAKCPLIIDADGINAVASDIDMLKMAKVPVILTPHIGEMARLCGTTADRILADKIGWGRKTASKYGVILVLKGAHTIVFEPDGHMSVNMSGNGGMATAGSGDMLAGMICSLLAQGMEPVWAARSAVYLHGKSGDLTAKHKSQRAMLPTDMINELPSLFLKYE